MRETTDETLNPALLPDTITIGGVVYRQTDAPPGYDGLAIHRKNREERWVVYVTKETREALARAWSNGGERFAFSALGNIAPSHKPPIYVPLTAMIRFDDIEGMF